MQNKAIVIVHFKLYYHMLLNKQPATKKSLKVSRFGKKLNESINMIFSFGIVMCMIFDPL